jgi:hypothetical protein
MTLNKTKSNAQKAVLSFALILVLSFIFAAPAFAATEIIAPSGNQTYQFSVDLEVDESAPYAGIQFGLTLSDESALTFVSFTLGDAVSGASAYPFIYAHGVHSFGFWTGANGYQGKAKVGTLNFAYTGAGPQTITVTEMMVMRIENNKPAGTDHDSPAYVFHVSRAAGAGDAGDTSGTGENPTGNTTGTGNPTGNAGGASTAGDASNLAGNTGGTGSIGDAGSGLTDISGGDTPLGDAGRDEGQGAWVIADEAGPLGNLPQTGAAGMQISRLFPLLALSLAAIGGAASRLRKKTLS